MRPLTMTEASGLQPNMAARLYVKRDSTTNLWCLAWMVPGDTAYLYDDGECSKALFRLKTEARAHGLKLYGVLPASWPH